MESVKVKVDGMTCMGCVRSVTNVLTGVAGVKSAAVSLKMSTAVVEHDDNIGETQLRKAIEDEGYTTT